MAILSVGSKFLSGMGKITAEKVGEKVGLALLADLFSEPAEFFLGKGLEALFGSDSSDSFKKVFEKLDQLEREIESAVGTISSVVEEAELEDPHVRIATYYSNLRTGATASEDITAGFQGAYESFFSQDVVDTLNSLNQDTQEIYDTLTGGGAISQPYLDLLVNGLYDKNADFEAFEAKTAAIGTLYITDLLHSALVLQCIGAGASDPRHKAKAEELIRDIGSYCSGISGKLETLVRDVPDLAKDTESLKFFLRNSATNKVLGRYVSPRSHSRAIITHFEMHDAGDGYFYLKASGKNAGIDHYYGKDIRPVREADSCHPNHLWRFDPAPSNPNRLYRVVNKATGSALDHYYGRCIKGAPNDEHPNHLWEVLPHSDGNSCCIVNHATGAVLGYDSSHNKIDAFPACYIIDAGSYNASLPIPNAWANAHWHLVQHGDEAYYNLVNQQSGEAIDHYDGESMRFVPSPSGHPNHLWRVEPTAVGDTEAYHFIRNKATGQVLDHYYGKSIEGASDSNASSPNAYHIWKFHL